jgi:CBS domain-containing protein
LTKWECYRCSYETDAENPPDECPNCHYSVSFWISHAEEKSVTLKDFVRRNIVELDGNVSVLEAAKIMKERDTENILVAMDGKPTGMLTDKDVVYKVTAEDLSPSKTKLKQVMSTPITGAPSDTPVNDALRIMAARHIQRIVVTEDGKPIGIVSHRSILGGSFRAAADSAEDAARKGQN